MANQSTMSAVPGTVFTVFSKLPKELRCMIWKKAIPKDQFYQVDRMADGDEIRRQVFVAIHKAMNPYLHTCMESRAVAAEIEITITVGNLGELQNYAEVQSLAARFLASRPLFPQPVDNKLRRVPGPSETPFLEFILKDARISLQKFRHGTSDPEGAPVVFAITEGGEYLPV